MTRRLPDHMRRKIAETIAREPELPSGAIMRRFGISIATIQKIVREELGASIVSVRGGKRVKS